MTGPSAGKASRAAGPARAKDALPSFDAGGIADPLSGA
jgi:hypothetical protein